MRERFDLPDNIETWRRDSQKSACFFIAYHAKTVWTDEELVLRIDPVDKFRGMREEGPRWDVIRTALGVKIPGKRAAKKKSLGI